ncbi:hypothetical protein [Thiocystis violacea]|uniref:hypothetical protein n=1 Tax=Thiocystis violacea TaxID=13725 RepID=UPI0019074D03|nr:hypothetical protein [Thiocystis violacea]MBK1719417.1 hypothetical protein [Thiocystis violacea]
MSTRYYEALAEIPQDHCLHLQLPPDIPAGPVRVAIIFEANPTARATGDDIKRLLRAMPDVGEDADFFRPRDPAMSGMWSGLVRGL